MPITHNFKEFCFKFNLVDDMQKAIEFYSVFAGAFDFCEFNPKNTLIQEINLAILNKLYLIENQIQKEYGFTQLEEKFLVTIAKSESKDIWALNRLNIHQSKSREICKKLINSEILKVEFSRERPIVKLHPKQKLKKSLRNYKIENRIKFKNNFLKFYFRFLHNEDELEKITQHLEEFISFIFEELSNEFIQKYFSLKPSKVGSYWDRLIEIDILVELENGLIAGECKWKNSKICKNILNSLQKKCQISNLEIKNYALFSKSGFSKELLKERDVILIDLDEFRKLLR